jgi:predicted nuclease of predicted toxin-antitoxin system
MKFKLDENIGRRGEAFLRSVGHDVETVRQEGLGGEDDERIFQAAIFEQRALITLDHDFGQVIRFPPEGTHGIVVLELPAHPTVESLLTRLQEFLAVLQIRPLENELWIVEPGRVRIHQREKEESS